MNLSYKLTLIAYERISLRFLDIILIEVLKSNKDTRSNVIKITVTIIIIKHCLL